MFSLSLLLIFLFVEKKEERGETEWTGRCLQFVSLRMVVACQSFPSKNTEKRKRGSFIYIFVCVCVLSPPLPPPFVYTHRENNNNNNELYVFVLILKWRNELLSRDDNHRNHKMSDAKKRRSWNTTTTTCTTFFRRIGKKDAGSLVSTIPLFCACWLPWRPDLHTTLWVSPNGQRQVYSTRKKKQQMIINRVIV